MLHPDGIYTDEKDEVYSYLFFNTTDLRPFYIIEKEMKQLNSYCELTIRSTKTKTEEMKNQLKDFQSGNIKEEQKYEDSEYPVDWDMVYEDIEFNEIPSWDDNVSFIAPSMSLVLLHIFIEKSLHQLCVDFYAPKKPVIKKNEKESVIQSKLRFLKEECNFNFNIEDDIFILLNKCRIIRNRFAHGDWKIIKSTINSINLFDAFRNVTNLFDSIEVGIPSKNIVKFMYEED